MTLRSFTKHTDNVQEMKEQYSLNTMDKHKLRLL